MCDTLGIFLFVDLSVPLLVSSAYIYSVFNFCYYSSPGSRFDPIYSTLQTTPLGEHTVTTTERERH